MPANIDLNSPITIPNGTKLDLLFAGSGPAGLPLGPNDDRAEFRLLVTLRTGTTQAKICARELIIADGVSMQLQRQTNPAPGLNIEDAERYFVHTANRELPTRSTPTGYTDLMNLWRAGSTPGNRNAAFKAALLSLGHIDASLAGT